MKVLLEYLELFWIFFRIGSITFGGGLAMLPSLQLDLVRRRNWLTSEQLIDYFAIGQATPGIIAVNVATFVGYNRKGIPGSLVTTVGVVTPSVIVITLLAMFLNNFADILWVQKALRGINVVVAVLLVSAVWNLGKKTLVDWIAFGIALASFIAMVVFNVSGVFIVTVSALLGLAARYRKGNISAGSGSAADGSAGNSVSDIDEIGGLD